MKIRTVILSLAVVGCSGGSAAVLSKNAAQASHRLTGVWDAVLSLDHPYPLEFKDPPARRVCGTIGFVDSQSQDHRSGPQSTGVYRLDLTRVGLNWLNDRKFPVAVASQHDEVVGRTHTDSVAITLDPDSQEHIVLRGVYRAAGIAGIWTAQSPRGTASGAFTLRPHSPGTESPSC